MTLALGLPLILPLAARAEETDAADTLREGLTTTGATAGFGEEEQSLYALIGGIISVLLGFLGVLILVYIVWAGYIYATSQGEKDKVDKAKKMLSTSVIGATILATAYVIVTYAVAAIQKIVTTSSS